MDTISMQTVMTKTAPETIRVVRGVRPEQLADVTPAAEWDVRALLNHLIAYTAHGLEHRARKEPLPEELAATDFAAEADFAEAYAVQVEKALAAWALPAAWEGEIEGMAAADYAAMLVLEIVLHGWDLAVATGQEYHADDEVADALLAVVGQWAPMYREYKGFADEVASAGSATAFDQALAGSGRDPQWVSGKS